jgi:DNA-binding NarL/FixJ family response regulator
MTDLRLLIVDAHPIIEEGLEFLFEDHPDLKIAATASDGLEGLEKLRQVPVDVVLVEISLPEVDGVEAIRLFLEERPELPILVYSGQNDETTVFRALKAGARGYILKTAPLPELIEAIRKVKRGDYALSTSLNPAIIEFYIEHRDQGFDPLAEYETLTEREKQVFRLLADGHQTREIADVLCISPKTVAKHRVAVKKKLALKNPAEMAQYAMRIGIIDATGPDITLDEAAS